MKNNFVSAAEASIRYVGRFDFSDPEGPVFAWSGCTIEVCFKGRNISAGLKLVNPSQTNNWINIILDDGKPVPVRIDHSGTYILAENLSDREHKLILTKRTEAFVGELQFQGFAFPGGGGLLAAPAAPSRRMEFIGDSITCGYGNESSRIEDGFQESQENNYIAYGSITARALGADQTTVSWSGIGIYQNYGGDTEGSMALRYPRTLPEREGSIWDHRNWTPDVVVINLGTNDFAQEDLLDKEAYTYAYKSLVKRLRGQYPKAHVFCAVGPLSHAPCTYIDKVVKEFNEAGDAGVHFVKFPIQDTIANGVGGDWHPSAKTHELMAAQMVKEIQNIMGW